MKKEMNIGLLGLGVVATGVVEMLAIQKHKIEKQTGVTLNLSKVLVLDKAEKQALAAEHGFELVTELKEITEDPTIDIVIELIGRISPAKDYILAALRHKKHVVTANKDLIAQHGEELIQVAKDHHVGFYYEASVAGGIPILRSLSTSYMADHITSIQGIVNGTTNYMLTKMVEEKMDYATALAKAQALGFAESDPTNDVDGIDAAYKMIILGAFAFGKSLTINDLSIEGIRRLDLADIFSAQSLGYEVKLVGEVKQTSAGISASVGPVLLTKEHPLATVKNENNGVYIESRGIGKSMLYGPGAGALPTATSVLADLIEIAKQSQGTQLYPPFNELKEELPLAPKEMIVNHYYLSVRLAEAMASQDKVNAYLEDQKQAIAFSKTEEVDRLILLLKNMTDEQLQEQLSFVAQLGEVQSVLRIMGEIDEN